MSSIGNRVKRLEEKGGSEFRVMWRDSLGEDGQRTKPGTDDSEIKAVRYFVGDEAVVYERLKNEKSNTSKPGRSP